MPADFLHLVRHGEVINPDRVLYGRLTGFGLTERGDQMARTVGQFFEDRPVSRIISSPLTRAVQTAEAIAEATHLSVTTDDRIIEGANQFEGSRVTLKTVLQSPAVWPRLWNPRRPSWGEAYRSVASRMLAAMDEAYDSVGSGEVVMVSHQLPIWTVHRQVAGVGLAHSPRSRRCSLCSVTTFHRTGNQWSEVAYIEPATKLLQGAVDLGAV